ncbi:hypothetical protein [Desulfobacula sp.]|uniref:hypothetical protein n=1 Tax=Desulfobacula sp. TaxID=2593537 RepID=UPI001ED23421|nr:hypothetical protein [Desulfobacula sp.]
MALLAVTAWKALPAVNQILGSITRARNALPYISNEIDYFTLIEADKSIKQDTTLQQPLDFSKTIKFNKVGFSYQDNSKQVIHDLSFEIEKGQTIGIIGTWCRKKHIGGSFNWTS